MSQRLRYEEQATPPSPVRPHTTEPTLEAEQTRRFQEPVPVYRKDADTLHWWQEDTERVRGLLKSVAVAVGLIYTLHALTSPLTAIGTGLMFRNISAGQSNNFLVVGLFAALSSIVSGIAAGYLLSRVASRHAVAAAALASGGTFALALLNGMLTAVISASGNPSEAGAFVMQQSAPVGLSVLTGAFFVLAAWLSGLTTHSKRARNR